MPWSFAERLQEAVEEKGWNQKVLSQRSGLNYSQVGKLLRGERTRVEAETVRKLARALEVTSDYLLGLDDEEKDFVGAAARLMSV